MSKPKKEAEIRKESDDQEVDVLLEDQEKIIKSINDYQAKIEELERNGLELKESSLRAMAEVENIKRRTEKEIKDIRKYTLSSFIESLVPVIENLYRSTEHVLDGDKKSESMVKIIEGIEMTKEEFLKILDKHEVKRIVPKSGDIFDHNVHQAITMVSDKDKKANTINNVIQAGYTINDRLIRPALVVVNS